MPTQTSAFTSTAQYVLAYEKELREGGLDDSLIADLVRDAAHNLHGDGLGVRTEFIPSGEKAVGRNA